MQMARIEWVSLTQSWCTHKVWVVFRTLRWLAFYVDLSYCLTLHTLADVLVLAERRQHELEHELRTGTIHTFS